MSIKAQHEFASGRALQLCAIRNRRIFRGSTSTDPFRKSIQLRYPAIVPHSSEKVVGLSGTGLCAECVHARRVESARGSAFLFCNLSQTDPRFPKYPRLPVLSCDGYKKKA